VRTFALRVIAAPFAVALTVLVVIHVGAAWLTDVYRASPLFARPENRHA
jgi:hypothetical protein